MRPESAKLCLLIVLACDDRKAEETPAPWTVVTFNTGTSESMGHDDGPDDGYGST